MTETTRHFDHAWPARNFGELLGHRSTQAFSRKFFTGKTRERIILWRCWRWARADLGGGLMPSSHRWHRQDKTVVSCLVGVRGVNWIGDKSRLYSSQMRSHRRRDWAKLFTIQYSRTTENWLRLSPTQFTPPTPTRRGSLVLSVSAVWTRHKLGQASGQAACKRYVE